MNEPSEPTNGTNRRVTDDRLLAVERSHEAMRTELHALVVQVTTAVAEIRGWRGNQEHMFDDFRHLLHEHHTLLHGKDGDTGLVVKVDRHESALRVVVWAGGLLVVCSLGFAGWMTQQAFTKVFLH